MPNKPSHAPSPKQLASGCVLLLLIVSVPLLVGWLWSASHRVKAVRVQFVGPGVEATDMAFPGQAEHHQRPDYELVLFTHEDTGPYHYQLPDNTSVRVPYEVDVAHGIGANEIRNVQLIERDRFQDDLLVDAKLETGRIQVRGYLIELILERRAGAGLASLGRFTPLFVASVLVVAILAWAYHHLNRPLST